MRIRRAVAVISTAMLAGVVLSAAPAQGQERTVTVTPAVELDGGDLVELSGTGWTPDTEVSFCQGAVPQAGEPTEAGLCDNGVAAGSVITDSSGAWSTTVRVRRFIYPVTRGSWVDCVPTGCAFGAGEGDPGTITGFGLGFATPPEPPTERGSISYTPAGGVAPGAEITVTGDGFRSDAVIELYQCTPGATDPSSCNHGPQVEVADGSGSFTAGFTVDQFVQPPSGAASDCTTSTCVIAAVEAVDFAGTAVEEPLYFPSPPARVVPGVGTLDEGDVGSASMEIPVSLSKPSNDEVTVVVDTYFIDQGSPIEADPSTDYDPVSSLLVTFAAGETEPTVPVTVTISGDLVFEPNEVFIVRFHDPTNAVMGGFYGLGFGVIANDDVAPVIVPGTVEVSEGAVDQVVEVPVSITSPAATAVTVEWNTVELEGTPLAATAGVDYASAAGTVTFEPGSTEALVPVRVTIIGDTVPETDELVVVEFHDPVGAPLGGFFGLGFVAILDDDIGGLPSRGAATD